MRSLTLAFRRVGILALGVALPAQGQGLPDLTGTWIGRVVCTEELGGASHRIVRESTLQIFQENPGLPALEVWLDRAGYMGFIVDPAEARTSGVGGLVACGSNDDFWSYAEIKQFDWRIRDAARGVSGIIRGRGLRSHGGFPIQECRGKWKRVDRAAPLINSCT